VLQCNHCYRDNLTVTVDSSDLLIWETQEKKTNKEAKNYLPNTKVGLQIL